MELSTIRSFVRYDDAAPLLEIIFYIREKLVTICHVSVLECLIELVACLAETEVINIIVCSPIK